MGNEQGTGTSHHFTPNQPNLHDRPADKRVTPIWTKNGRIPLSRQATNLSETHLQLARDASMDILSKRTVKLASRQGMTETLKTQRTMIKKTNEFEGPTWKRITTIYQTPRMPTEREVSRIAIAYQAQCSFCEGPCIGDYLRCRVCIRIYHCQCLTDRGYTEIQTLRFSRLGKQDWSCPECKDLTRLLTEEEIGGLIGTFERINRKKDGSISWIEFRDFMKKCRVVDCLRTSFENFEDLEKEFRLMNTKQNGKVDWLEFSLFYTSKLLAGKNRTILTNFLSQKELAFAKSLFLTENRMEIDAEGNMLVTKNHLNRVVDELVLILKKKIHPDLIDSLVEQIKNNSEAFEKYSVFGWDEFLRQISVFVLLNRSNYDIKLSQIYRSTPTIFISHGNLTNSNDSEPKTKINVSRTEHNKINVSSDFDSTESFRKHGKILEKLHQREEQRTRLQNQCPIVENIDEDFFVPKLKVDSKDERDSITNPWLVVKQMQHLRNQPILITSTRLQTINV